jgi:putative DNA primase/helicase
LQQPARLGLVSAAWKLLNEHPDLYQPNVVWDEGGYIAVANGVLDPVQRTLDDWRPELHLRRKLQVAFDPASNALIFAGFVNSLFSDHDEETRNRSLGLLQEFFGACLAIGKLNREQRRALLLVGPSRVGKSELARLVRLLVGDPVAAPAVAEIGERFGLSCFIGARAWIRDDAVNEGDRLNPERFKTIVTGEPIDIERKNRPALPSVRLNIPVLLTANGLPTARDSSDAIFNRCLVVEMTNVVDEKTAVDYRQRLGVPSGSPLAHWLFEREGAGILNWALDGLARLLQRGQFDIPDHVAQSIRRFKDEANPVAE